MGEDLKKQQIEINEKYKTLLQSKEKELDQAEKDAVVLKNKLKQMKEELKSKKSNDSKEMTEIKEQKKKLKKDNESKVKLLGQLEDELKGFASQNSKLKEDCKSKDKALAKKEATLSELKKEVAVKADELTNLQVSNQKLIKVRHELKQQNDELNKMYNKSLVESRKSAEAAEAKTQEINQLNKTIEAEKEKIDVELKTVKDELTEKERKINKLLDVLVKRGDHIKELKNNESELNKKLTEKEDQYVDVVAKYKKKIDDKDKEMD